MHIASSPNPTWAISFAKFLVEIEIPDYTATETITVYSKTRGTSLLCDHRNKGMICTKYRD